MRAVERVGGQNPYKVRFRLLGRQSSRRFRTHREAVRFATILDADGVQTALEFLEAHENSAAVPTLDQWAPQSIAARSGLGSGQRRDYQMVFDRTWAPLLGRMQLHEIRKADVSRALVELSERGGTKRQGLSDKSVANAHGILSGLMSDAVDAGYIASSPCKGIKMPRRTSHTSTEMRFLSRDEFARLLAATPPHWQPLMAFLAGTGCRWGEASALLASDLDVDNGVVRIRRALKWNGNSVASRTIGPPKTRRSRRSIALPPDLVTVLRPLVRDNSPGELFRAPLGGPAHHGYFWRKVWSPAVRRAELSPVPRIHDLRHSHASWLIASGIDLVAISRRLGHESITVTADRYGHLTGNQDAKAAAALQGLGLRHVERDANAIGN